MTDNATMPATGTQVFVNWYGHVVEGKVLDHDQHASHPMYRDWVAILMEIPASNGKPIVQGCFNTCMFHKSHVYLTSEAAAQAWANFRQASLQRQEPTAQPQQKPSFADTLRVGITRDKWQNFKAAHWDAQHNHMQVDYLEEGYQLYRAMIAAERNIQVKATVPAASPAVEQKLLKTEQKHAIPERNLLKSAQKTAKAKQKKKQDTFTQLSFKF